MIIKLLKNIDLINDRLDSIEYVSRNGKSQRWISIPQSNHERSYDDFRKNYPKETLNRFLLSMGGTISQGLAILSTYYQRSYQSEFLLTTGLSQDKHLGVIETVALQQLAGLTHYQRRIIHSFIRSHLGYSLLAANHPVESYRNPYGDEFITAEYNGMPFRYVSLRESLLNFLWQLRDAFYHDLPGKQIGRYGTAAEYVIHGDRGDAEFKELVTFNFREKDDQTFSKPLGWFKGEESYDNIAHTLAPIHDEEIGVLNTQSILWIKLESRAFFAIVPRSCFHSSTFRSISLQCRENIGVWYCS